MHPNLTKALLSHICNGYLFETGWIKSFLEKKPLDNNNEALPWVTYSFIDFIDNRLSNEMRVFEYGSGNSTLFYAKKVESITSVEHEKEWFDKIKKLMPINSKLIYQELHYNGEYSATASKQEEKYDLIIVDGRDRVNCLKKSINALSERGVIVLDDSEREDYKECYEFMKKNKYKFIDFWGIAPGIFFKKCTTLFYKPDNINGKIHRSKYFDERNKNGELKYTSLIFDAIKP